MRQTEDGVAVLPQRVAAGFDGVLRRIGLRRPLARDCAFAIVVTALTVLLTVPVLRADVAGLDGHVLLTDAQVNTILAAGAVQSAVLALRRIRPVTCLLVVVGAQLVIIASTPPDFSVRVIAPFVIAYTVGAMLTTKRALAVAVVVALIEGTGAVLLTIDAAPFGPMLVIGHVGQALITYGPGVLLGTYVRTRRAYLALLRAQADEAVRSREAAVRSAISDERRGIARELHDVAAHHLSGMVVQASAVQRLIDRDPEAAKAANAWIRSQGKETLADLRSVVGLLRSGTDLDPNTPVPGLGSLEELVRAAGELGSQVELIRVGPAPQLPPLTDVSLYRIAQQALTNARQHAPGSPVRLTLTHTGTEVDLEVTNRSDAQRSSDKPDASHASRAEAGAGAGSREATGLDAVDVAGAGSRQAAGTNAFGGDGLGPQEATGPTAVAGADSPAHAAESSRPPHAAARTGGERHGVGLVGMRERARLVGARLTAGPNDEGGWTVRVIAPTPRAEPDHDEKGATS